MTNAIKNARTQEEVVAAINHAADMEQPLGVPYFGGFDTRSSEEMAGEYAFTAASEGDYGTGTEELESHLEFITEAGATFNLEAALAEAVRLRGETKA